MSTREDFYKVYRLTRVLERPNKEGMLQALEVLMDDYAGIEPEIWSKVKACRALTATSSRQQRLAFLRQRQYWVKDGPVYLYIWGIDCDHMESASAHRFDNRWQAEVYLECILACAEGPTSYDWMTESEYTEFTGYWRDHAAEAAGY